MYRYSITIVDLETNEVVVFRFCNSFSFTVRRRRNPDLPTHEIIASDDPEPVDSSREVK